VVEYALEAARWGPSGPRTQGGNFLGGREERLAPVTGSSRSGGPSSSKVSRRAQAWRRCQTRCALSMQLKALPRTAVLEAVTDRANQEAGRLCGRSRQVAILDQRNSRP